MKTVLIFASSNPVGNTAEICNLLTESTSITTKYYLLTM